MIVAYVVLQWERHSLTKASIKRCVAVEGSTGNGHGRPCCLSPFNTEISDLCVNIFKKCPPNFYTMGKNKGKSKNSKPSNPLLAAALRKNVIYKEGIPKSVYNYEKVYELVLPSTLQAYTLTTGGIASATSLDPSSRIGTWSRWSAIFQQFIVLKMTVTLQTVLNSTGIGEVWGQVRESSSTPTSAMATQERAVVSLAAYQDPLKNSFTITWTPRSAEDVTFTSTNTGFTPAYFAVYADSTNTLTSASDNTTKLALSIYYHLAFRYLA